MEQRWTHSPTNLQPEARTSAKHLMDGPALPATPELWGLLLGLSTASIYSDRVPSHTTGPSTPAQSFVTDTTLGLLPTNHDLHQGGSSHQANHWAALTGIGLQGSRLLLGLISTAPTKPSTACSDRHRPSKILGCVGIFPGQLLGILLQYVGKTPFKPMKNKLRTKVGSLHRP